jgi:hypothetical protein
MIRTINLCRRDDREAYTVLFGTDDGEFYAPAPDSMASLEAQKDSALGFLRQHPNADFNFGPRTVSEIKSNPYPSEPEGLDEMQIAGDCTIFVQSGIDHCWCTLWRGPDKQLISVGKESRFAPQVLIERIEEFFAKWGTRSLEHSIHSRHLMVRGAWKAAEILPNEFELPKPTPATPAEIKERNRQREAYLKSRARQESHLKSAGFEKVGTSWAQREAE